MLATLIAGALIYSCATSIALFVVLKYRSQISHSLGLFYFVTISALLLRIAYYIAMLFKVKLRIQVILMVLPSALILDITLIQINIYTQLILRVSALKQSMIESNTNADAQLKRKELLLYIALYTMILIYPILFIVEFATIKYSEEI